VGEFCVFPEVSANFISYFARQKSVVENAGFPGTFTKPAGHQPTPEAPVPSESADNGAVAEFAATSHAAAPAG